MRKQNKLMTGRSRDDNIQTGSPLKSGGKRVLQGFERECVCVCVCVCGQNTCSDGDGCVGSSFISGRCFSVPLPCITHTPSIHCCIKKPGGVRQAND